MCGEAENGEIAVEKVIQLTPDLVVLDFQMPVMGGLEAARRIAEVSPHTTIVMFTLHNCEQVEQDAQAAGITHVLSRMEGGAKGLLTLLKTMSFAG